MNDFGAGRVRDGVLLIARILLAVLFVIFGWKKLTGFTGTGGYFTHLNLPMPTLAAIIAVVMEFFAGIAIVLGVLTRPVAVLLAVYTIATGFLGHPYWTMTGMEQVGAMINFYKNVSIAGGFLLLYVCGAGKYSVDARVGLEAV
jgi:putative oxidoreductase